MQNRLEEDELQASWGSWSSSGDPEARERLVRHYLSLVEFLAAQLRPQVSAYLQPELYSFGVIGLLDALDKFRPELGNRFETYGASRIRGAIRDGVRQSDALPRDARKRASRVIECIVPVDFQTATSPVGVKLQDCLADSSAPTALDGLELAADYEELREAIAALPDRESTVIREYYYKGRFLKAIGDELGLTESRVCQIHRKALAIMERYLVSLRAA